MSIFKKFFGRKKKKKEFFDPTKYFKIDEPHLIPVNCVAGGADVRVIVNGALVPEAFFFGFEARSDGAHGRISLYYFSKYFTKINNGDNIDIEIAFEDGYTTVHHFRNVNVELEWGAFSEGELATCRNVEFTSEKMETEHIAPYGNKNCKDECYCKKGECE